MTNKLKYTYGTLLAKNVTEESLVRRIFINQFRHYRKADAVLLLYDITKEKTFESVP